MPGRVLRAMALPLLVFCTLLPVRLPADSAAHTARKPAPGFSLTDERGSPVRLADYQGQVVLLNFWATWCHGCKLEIPWFMEYQSKYEDRGFTVIGISMDDDDGWKSVKPFLAEKKLNYPVVIGNESLGKLYGLDSMPKSLLIDRDANVAYSYSGMVDKDGCENQIRALLAADKPGH